MSPSSHAAALSRQIFRPILQWKQTSNWLPYIAGHHSRRTGKQTSQDVGLSLGLRTCAADTSRIRVATEEWLQAERRFICRNLSSRFLLFSVFEPIKIANVGTCLLPQGEPVDALGLEVVSTHLLFHMLPSTESTSIANQIPWIQPATYPLPIQRWHGFKACSVSPFGSNSDLFLAHLGSDLSVS